MSPTPRGYPTFTGSLPPAGPTQMQQLAEAIDNDVSKIVPRLTPIVYEASTTAAGTYTATTAILVIVIPAAPFARLLDIDAQIYGGAISGSWQAGLSVVATNWDGSQRLSTFPTSGEATLTLNLPYTLPANTSTGVRLWYRRVSASGSISNVGTGGASGLPSGSFTNVTVKAWQL